MSHPPFPMDCESRPLTGSFTSQGVVLGVQSRVYHRSLTGPPKPNGTTVCWLRGGWASRSAGAQPCPVAAGAGSAQWALATPHLAEDTSASAVTTGPPAGDRDALCPGPACPAPAGPLRPARVRHFWYGPWASPSPAPLADEVSRPGVPSGPPSGHRKPL